MRIYLLCQNILKFIVEYFFGVVNLLHYSNLFAIILGYLVSKEYIN